MTTPANGYCTLTEILAFLPNSTNETTAQLEQSIEAASRAIEMQTGRVFYPALKTNRYDLPELWFTNELQFVDDALELLTVTNGDDTTIASTEYNLYPLNSYPKKRLVLKNTSTVSFEADADGNGEAVLDIYGVWACHKNYGAAWLAATTLNGAIASTSATTFTATSGTPLAAGQVIRIDNELLLVTNVSTNTITITRAWNGSTAATHDTASVVKIWQYEGDIKRATLIQATRYYKRATAIFGTTGGGEMGAQPVQLAKLDPDVMLIIEPYTENY
jgi:hypothetical protein